MNRMPSTDLSRCNAGHLKLHEFSYNTVSINIRLFTLQINPTHFSHKPKLLSHMFMQRFEGNVVTQFSQLGITILPIIIQQPFKSSIYPSSQLLLDGKIAYGRFQTSNNVAPPLLLLVYSVFVCCLFIRYLFFLATLVRCHPYIIILQVRPSV